VTHIKTQDEEKTEDPVCRDKQTDGRQDGSSLTFSCNQARLIVADYEAAVDDETAADEAAAAVDEAAAVDDQRQQQQQWTKQQRTTTTTPSCHRCFCHFATATAKQQQSWHEMTRQEARVTVEESDGRC
jgi:hypothetical protein